MITCYIDGLLLQVTVRHFEKLADSLAKCLMRRLISLSVINMTLQFSSLAQSKEWRQIGTTIPPPRLKVL